MKSQWVIHEWTTMLQKQLSGKGAGVVVPLRLDPVDPPTILAPLQRIDLYPDFDAGLSRLTGFLLSEIRPSWLVQRQFKGKDDPAELGKDKDLRGTPPAKPDAYSNETWRAWHSVTGHEPETDRVLSQLDNRTIRRISLHCVTIEQLSSFCFDTDTPQGSLAGDSLNEKILSLLHLLLREGRLEEFIRWLAKEDPRCVKQALSTYLPSGT